MGLIFEYQGLSSFCVPEDKDAVLLNESPEICCDNEFGVVSGAGSYQASQSCPEAYRSDFENEEIASYPDLIDSLDQCFESEYTWPYLDSGLATFLSSSPEKRPPIDKFDDFSHLDVSEEEDADDVLEFRDRLGSESPDSWYKYDDTSAELNLRNASTCCDWSGDDDNDSQEKLNLLSMGMALAPNVESLKPHKFPGSRLARINEFGLDSIRLEVSSHHGFRASPSNHSDDMSDTDGECLISDEDMNISAAGIECDAKEIWINIDAPMTALQFDYDSGTDSISLDHGSTELENPPNAAALSLGNDITVTVERVSTIIPPDEDPSFGTQRRPLATGYTNEQEESPKVPDDCGFLAIDFD
ncbi:hypothetical protein CVT25_000474 [Psilocybe cyanescens]|uniref:Uncharacterized protein n=1 Tax=Psilocybe cyanescens TaxID=93625 RepID=A0A409VNZ9_PSICY|nr:hypothetical protein CVT25_000474 [Psilocybe cyanescens]